MCCLLFLWTASNCLPYSLAHPREFDYANLMVNFHFPGPIVLCVMSLLLCRGFRSDSLLQISFFNKGLISAVT